MRSKFFVVVILTYPDNFTSIVTEASMEKYIQDEEADQGYYQV